MNPEIVQMSLTLKKPLLKKPQAQSGAAQHIFMMYHQVIWAVQKYL